MQARAPIEKTRTSQEHSCMLYRKQPPRLTEAGLGPTTRFKRTKPRVGIARAPLLPGARAPGILRCAEESEDGLISVAH
jgi:hypothetical protein